MKAAQNYSCVTNKVYTTYNLKNWIYHYKLRLENYCFWLEEETELRPRLEKNYTLRELEK